MAYEIGDPGRHHQQPDAVSRTSLPGDETGRDPDGVENDLSQLLRSVGLLEAVRPQDECGREGYEQQRGHCGRDEQAAAHPGASARLATAAAERSSLWIKPRARLRSSRVPKSAASRLDVRTTSVAAPLSAIRSATSNPSVSGRSTSSSTS